MDKEAKKESIPNKHKNEKRKNLLEFEKKDRKILSYYHK
jgi:hypothetical protein